MRELATSPVDLDGDGVAETSERAWYYEYDPRFGSERLQFQPEGSKGIRLMDIARERNGDPWSVIAASFGGRLTQQPPTDVTILASSGVRLTAQPASCTTVNLSSGFVTAATDPRGNVTTATYDAKGNKTRHRPPGSQAMIVNTATLSYNTYGQLTTVTNAADANGYRRVDTFSYYASGSQTGYLQSIAIDEPGVHLTSAFEYDARGNLTRYVDPRTNDWLYTYNALDQCVRAQTPVNVSARCAKDFSYDANDNLVQSTTELRDADDILVGARVNRASYDSRPRLTHCVSTVDATRSMTNQFVYDGNGQCVQMLGGDAVSGADPHQTVAFQYDERGLLFREIAAPGSADQSTTQLDYDMNGNVTRVSEGLEGTPSVTTMEYDGFVSLGVGVTACPQVFTPPALRKIAAEVVLLDIKENFAEGQSRVDGNPIRHFPYPTKDKDTDFRISWKGVGKTMAHDDWDTGMSRLSKITDPMGNVTTFNFDPCDNLRVVRKFGELNDVPGTNGNVRLAESRYEYDALNRRVRARDAFFDIFTQAPIGDGERTTTFSNAPNGQLVSVTDDLGRVTRFGYDTAGRAVSTTDARHNVVIIAQDACGNVNSRTSTELLDLGGPPQVFTTTYAYDNLNRCVSASDNVGNTNRYAYDSLSRVTAQFNPREYKRTFAYDLLDRRTLAVTDLDGDGLASLTADVTATATWSSSSARLLSTTDSHTNTTTYAYDSLGRCTNATSPDGTKHVFVWDSAQRSGQRTGRQRHGHAPHLRPERPLHREPIHARRGSFRRDDVRAVRLRRQFAIGRRCQQRFGFHVRLRFARQPHARRCRGVRRREHLRQRRQSPRAHLSRRSGRHLCLRCAGSLHGHSRIRTNRWQTSPTPGRTGSPASRAPTVSARTLIGTASSRRPTPPAISAGNKSAA